MNRIYQVIWSSVKDCYVVVSENAGRHGKKKAVHLAPSTTKRTMLAMSLGAAVLMGSGAAAEAASYRRKCHHQRWCQWRCIWKVFQHQWRWRQ